MQVEVRLMVLSDEGVPLLGAVRIDSVIQKDDVEGNLLRAAARLEDLRRDAEKAVQAQVRAVRESV